LCLCPDFYPRDAVLARVLAMFPCLCLPVCLSVCHKSVFYRNGRMNRAWFWHESFLTPILKGNSGISENEGTSVWNFVINSGLKKFCFGISIVETCYRLSSAEMDAQSVINRVVSRPLVYHSDRQALSTARFRRASQLATADTYLIYLLLDL